MFRIERLTAKPLSVPLTSPFVIASARVDVTPNVLVEVEVVDTKTGARAVGLGEAATLHPVSEQTQADVLTRLAQLVTPVELPLPDELHGSNAQGLFMALEDALARLEGRPLRSALAGEHRVVEFITTDITLPIGEPAAMAQLAREWRARGFTCFKVKVGKDADADLRALEQIHRAVPDATFRIDANAAFTAAEAIALAKASERLGLVVECFEQPCGKHALDAMAEVAAALTIPVIADESFQGLEDVALLAKERAADGINLKLAKLGTPRAAVQAGRLAREKYGMKLMMGAMVETRLGITAAANVAAALGGVEFPDLDTALLLAADPFRGGYLMSGARLELTNGPGLDLQLLGRAEDGPPA